MRQIALGAVFLFGLVLLAGCSPGVSQGEYDALVSELNDLRAEVEALRGEGEEKAPPTEYASVKLGETFEFDGLEITFGKSFTEAGLYYESAPQDSYRAIEIPVTVTNHSGQARALSGRHILALGPGDVPLEAVPAADFSENAQDRELAGGESFTGKLYIRKKGTGSYSVLFDNGSEQYELRIRVRN